MKNKKYYYKILKICLPIITIFLIVNVLANKYNMSQIKTNINSINTSQAEFNDIIPFSWDKAYFFQNGDSKEKIYDTIGFYFFSAKEVPNENYMNIYFIKDNSVVFSINKTPDELGFLIKSKNTEVLYENNKKVKISENNQIKILEIN